MQKDLKCLPSKLPPHLIQAQESLKYEFSRLQHGITENNKKLEILQRLRKLLKQRNESLNVSIKEKLEQDIVRDFQQLEQNKEREERRVVNDLKNRPLDAISSNSSRI